MIGLVDYLASVSQTGVTLQTILNAASLTLFGAHHRPLMDYPQQGNACGWITGDFAGSGRGDRRNFLSEVGICHNLGEQVRVGLGGGYDHSRQDLSLGGKASSNGYHLIGEIDVRPADTPLLLSLTAYYADWNVAIDRAYRNGASIDHSRGSSGARAWAIRGRIDWRDMFQWNDGGFSPYLAFSHGRVTLDGYTETGGAFPFAVTEAKVRMNEFRLGGTARLPLSKTVQLHLSGEGVHRLDDGTATLSGTILGGLGNFTVAAPAANRNWARLGTDLDLSLSQSTLLSLSGHAMLGQGEDARLGGSISLRHAF